MPTTATATTLPVVKKCRGVTARLVGIAGEFTIWPLVVRGLTHPVNLGQHFLGRHWCSLDFATGCTQLGVWGQSGQGWGSWWADWQPDPSGPRRGGSLERSGSHRHRWGARPGVSHCRRPLGWGRHGEEGSCAL